MTKLEEKLLKLGYKSVIPNNWYKLTRHKFVKRIVLSNGKIEKDKCGVQWVKRDCNNFYKTQQDIDKLQQAFNQLQNDLKELKEYE